MHTGTTAMTLRELLTERYAYLHHLSDRSVVLFSSTLDRLREHLGREAVLEDLNDLAMAKFLRWRAATPIKGKVPSPATVAKDRAHLGALANHAWKKRLIQECVEWPRLKVPTRIPRGYTVDEVSAVIRAARHRRGRVGRVPAAWFWMTLPWAAFVTGERIGALLRLRWGEADIDRRVLTFLGETRKDRSTTIQRDITSDLADVLRPQIAGATQLVWPWLDCHVQASIYVSLSLLCRSAGVVPRGFHAFRKGSGSYVKAAGGDPTEHLGHRNPRTTQVYMDPAITGRQSAVDFLPQISLAAPRPPVDSSGQGSDAGA